MDPSLIVAVASSAGDLEAVCELLSTLPAECAAAFIIVQHVDSDRERLLYETLAKRTSRPVMRAHDGAVVEQGHVYVITANTTLTMASGRIRMTASPTGLYPGDILFTSLAKDHGHGAIGVVLSGEESDGALGIQAIKRAGGAAFAQYPGSARFPSMPISAIETGCVDFVLHPNEIAHELAHRSRYTAPPAFSLPVPALVAALPPAHPQPPARHWRHQLSSRLARRQP
jgi:two-component system CheB/CheR fusion protein